MQMVSLVVAWSLLSVVAAHHGGQRHDVGTGRQCLAPMISGRLSSNVSDPWSHQPHCITWRPKSPSHSKVPVQTHCLFTQASFGDGHGFSLITKAEIASELLSYDTFADESCISETGISRRTGAAFSPGPVLDPETNTPAYEVRELPGKGKAVIALRHISKNEVFMLDRPAIVASADFSGMVWTKKQENMLELAVRQLPEPTRKGVLGLAKAKILPDMPLGDIFATNTCGLLLGEGVSHVGLFVEVSRMNHACVPNAFFRFSSRTLQMEVFAYRDIYPGEEILINYAPLGMPYHIRRQYLEANYGFICRCALCNASRGERDASDQRRAELSALRKRMGTALKLKDWPAVASYASQALETLSEAEALTPLAFEFHEELARAHLEMGNLGLARNHGNEALSGFVHLRGPDSHRARELRNFLKVVDRKQRRV